MEGTETHRRKLTAIDKAPWDYTCRFELEGRDTTGIVGGRIRWGWVGEELS